MIGMRCVLKNLKAWHVNKMSFQTNDRDARSRKIW